MSSHELDKATRSSLGEYAERGTARGADAVLDAARHEDQVYVAYAKPPARRRWVGASVAAAIVVVLVATIAVLSNDGGDGVYTATRPETSTTVSQEVLDEATDRLMEQRAAGWIPVAPDPAIAGVEVPSVAWIRAGESVAPLEFDPQQLRVPVYDEMDGVVIGYDYQELGFVPLAVADSGEFDAAQARVDKYGCDLLLDANCRSQVVEDRARATE